MKGCSSSWSTLGSMYPGFENGTGTVPDDNCDVDDGGSFNLGKFVLVGDASSTTDVG